MNMLISLVLLVVGFVLLVKGADWFVEGASGIAERFGIPQIVIGLTIVAMGTSLPEAAVSITSAAKGSADITIGNIVGSNIMNVLIILGFASVVAPLVVQATTAKYEIPFVLIVTVIFYVLGMDGNVSRIDGVILWALFLVYFVYLARMAKLRSEQGEVQEEAAKPLGLWQAIGMTVLGAVLIVAGANIAVDAATDLARIFGMSERLIGLTIVALGTSLPELATSVAASYKGKADIAIGNIVGSCIFNILFVVGTSSLIIPVPFQSGFLTDTLWAVAALVALFLLCVRDKKLQRWNGAVLLAMYVAYFVTLIR